MADSRTVSGNISVEQDGRYGSALKLMEKIGQQEYNSKSDVQKTRNYWLSLYVECMEATYRNSPK